jgi:hypothetical protein
VKGAAQAPTLRQRMAAASWRDIFLAALPALLVLGVTGWVAAKASRLAPPGTIRLISGPPGSGFRTQADKYKQIL